MRIVFGRLGLIGSPAGDRIRELEPGWELAEASGTAWPGALADADVAIPVTSPFGALELERSSVRFVQQFGVGLDSVDLAACARRQVPVANVPSSASGNATAVAELAVLMTLALARNLDGARAAVRGQGPQLGFTHSLAGRRIVLIGLGGIGREIAVRLTAFRVTIHAVRAHPEHGGAPGVDDVHGIDDLDTLLREADGVILCAPPGPGPLFTADRFAALRRGAFLVNVARGTLIDEHALLDALNDGTLSGAGLDVLTDEPAAPDSALVQHPQVIVTPHIGGVTFENLIGTAEAVVDNIRRFNRDEPLQWQQQSRFEVQPELTGLWEERVGGDESKPGECPRRGGDHRSARRAHHQTCSEAAVLAADKRLSTATTVYAGGGDYPIPLDVGRRGGVFGRHQFCEDQFAG